MPLSLAEALGAYLKSLRERLEDVEVYLFGSFARGDWLMESDIDLIVISDAFKGMDLLERLKLLKTLAPPSLRVSPLPYTREELEERRRTTLISDAMSYAVRLTP